MAPAGTQPGAPPPAAGDAGTGGAGSAGSGGNGGVDDGSQAGAGGMGASGTAGTPTITDDGDCPTGLVGWASVDADGVSTTTGGGNATPQRVVSIGELRDLAGDGTARVIEISGTMETGTSPLEVASNKTLVGIGTDATIKGGINLSGQHNVIIRNLNIQGAGQEGSKPSDSVGVRGSHHLWFDHLNIWDGPDGILDLTKGTTHATVSWCKFWYTESFDHRLALLFGGGSDHDDTDTGKNNHTVHHNWFAERVDQRMPRLLFGKGHIFNNYFNSPGNSYCIGSGSWASIYVENNYFKDVKSPHRFQDGNPSYIEAVGNEYDNTSGDKDTGLGNPDNDAKDPVRFDPTTVYSYADALHSAAEVPAIVTRCAGPR